MDASTFKNLIFKMCGDKYHRVELDDDVWNYHIIPKINQKFSEFHFDGSTKMILPLSIIPSQTVYDLSDLDYTIESVTSILAPETVPGTISPIRLYRESMMRNGNTQNLSDFTFFQGWISQHRITVGNYYHYSYNKIARELSIFNPSQCPSEIFLECHIDRVADLIESIRENPLYQEMAKALTLMEWSEAHIKYERALIGGSTIKYDAILERGKDLWEKCLEELKNEQSEQPDIEFG